MSEILKSSCWPHPCVPIKPIIALYANVYYVSSFTVAICLAVHSTVSRGIYRSWIMHVHSLSAQWVSSRSVECIISTLYQGCIDSPKERRGHASRIGLLYTAKFKHGSGIYFLFSHPPAIRSIHYCMCAPQKNHQTFYF